ASAEHVATSTDERVGMAGTLPDIAAIARSRRRQVERKEERTTMFARLTDEQEAIRDAVREFAQKEIAPHADQWDEEHSFPREIFRPMAEMGLAGLLAPEGEGCSAPTRADA